MISSTIRTFRGFMFIILMLILLMLALRFPYARQAQTVTAQEFEQILGSGNVAEAVISPNPQTPSGYVTVTLASAKVHHSGIGTAACCSTVHHGNDHYHHYDGKRKRGRGSDQPKSPDTTLFRLSRRVQRWISFGPLCFNTSIRKRHRNNSGS